MAKRKGDPIKTAKQKRKEYFKKVETAKKIAESPAGKVKLNTKAMAKERTAKEASIRRAKAQQRSAKPKSKKK